MNPPQRTALIGYTGFVGGTLLRARRWDDRFRSTDIADIRGRNYDLVVCAGVSAAKWLANGDPEGDRRGIAKLTDALAEVEAHEFVLVSTIDVYPDPASGDDEDSAIDPSANHAYGRNRYELECWVRDHFPLCRIVRLPALFGEGLRKNALFDLLHGNRTEAINPAGVFQWYPLRRLHDDLERVRAADLRLVNLFTQPFATQEVVDAFFPGARVGPPSRPAARYDLRTKHNAELGGQRGYLLDTTTVLGEMAQYVSGERRGRSAAAEAGARG